MQTMNDFFQTLALYDWIGKGLMGAGLIGLILCLVLVERALVLHREAGLKPNDGDNQEVQ